MFGRTASEQDDQVDPGVGHPWIVGPGTSPNRRDGAGKVAGMRFTAGEVAAATGGRLVGPDVRLDGAAFDSRTLRPGQLFVPIVAQRDGHDFIAEGLAAGAPAYLTRRPPPEAGVGTAIVVTDTAAALMDLGRWARGRLPDRVVGVTGSVGKTSVKDLTAAALGCRFRTAANVRSFNNEQGLPITLLEAAGRHRGRRARDGHPRPRRDAAAVHRRPPHRRRRHRGRRRAHPAARRPRRGGRSQGRAGRSAAGRLASRC